MKKCICLVFALILSLILPFSSLAAGFDVPETVSVTASSVYIVNLDTGLPVVDINSGEARSIASLTKIMTALLLIENVEDLDSTTMSGPTSLFVSPITDSGSSTADIRPNEVVTARTLLYAMMLPSGNEAAAIVAYNLGNENPANFYAMMNARAKELGCVNTNFTNPHGLGEMDEGNYSTAYDLSLIATACWQYDVFREVVGSLSYDMPFTNYHTTAEYATKPEAAYTIYNTNRMLQPTATIYRDYIKGIKTGSTHSAGRNLASAAVNSKGETYISIVLGCPWDAAEDGYAYSFHDTLNLFDWIFANFSVQPSLDTEKPITEVTVRLSSETDVVKLLPEEDLKTILPTDGGADLLEEEYNVPESINAPVKAGDVVGSVTLRLQGELVGTVSLIAAEDVERNTILYIFDCIGLFFKGTYFKVVLILSGIYALFLVAIVLWLRMQQNRRRQAKRRRAQKMQNASPPIPQGGQNYPRPQHTGQPRRPEQNPEQRPPQRNNPPEQRPNRRPRGD